MTRCMAPKRIQRQTSCRQITGLISNKRRKHGEERQNMHGEVARDKLFLLLSLVISSSLVLPPTNSISMPLFWHCILWSLLREQIHLINCRLMSVGILSKILEILEENETAYNPIPLLSNAGTKLTLSICGMPPTIQLMNVTDILS